MSLMKFDTAFNMSFDFTSAEQRSVLRKLQADEYQLVAYKGASGPQQISAGLPTWFAVPFGNLFGKVDINYTPRYKVYAFNHAKIAANTTIETTLLSGEVGLGTALNFEQDGRFTSAGAADAGTITLECKRESNRPNITVGLAGLVQLPDGAKFLPFCAFTLTPKGSISMSPTENVALMAARVNLKSGNVQANAAAPGCTFTFDKGNVDYDLMVKDNTFAVTHVPGTAGVQPLGSGNALALLNS